MKSGELAKLAGVTPRALRHYRDIGLLAEPKRDSNGYCDYRARDLVKVLRIKNLTTLGFSLEKIAHILESLDTVDVEKTADYLDDLDKELALQIEQLKQKRRTIALLKGDSAAADVPADFAKYVSRLVSEGHSAEHVELERGGLILATHFLDEEGLGEVAAVLDGFLEEGLAEAQRDLNMKFFELRPDATEEEKRSYTQEAIALLDQVISLDMLTLGDETTEVISKTIINYQEETYNPAQLDVIRRIEEEYTARLLLKDA